MKSFEKNIYVIIPVYNGYQYLQQAVDSVKKQKYTNLYIIIVDDGSTDETGDLCDLINRSYSNVHVIHKENGGVSSARNAGLEYVYSVGSVESYVAFLDSDDAWTPDIIDENLIDLMEYEYDLIGMQSLTCDQELAKCSEPTPLKEGLYTGGSENVWIHSSQHFGSMLYKISLLKNNNIRFPSIKYSEDKVFSLECLYLAKQIYLKNRLFYLYRNNTKSAVSNRKYGIDYYDPIIKAYMNMDTDLEDKLNCGRGTIQFGSQIAKYYMAEMADEHYKFGGTTGRLNDYLRNNPSLLKLYEEDNTQSAKQESGRGKNPVSVLLRRIYARVYLVIRKSVGQLIGPILIKRKYPYYLADILRAEKE